MENQDQACSGNGCCRSMFSAKHLIALVLILGAITLGIVSLVRDRIVNPDRNQVSFTADAKVFAKPDIAQIQLAVKTERSKDAVTAVKNNTAKMNAVTDKLKELGIEDKDVKTTNYNLSPEYDYTINVGRSTLAGYSVYQEVTVKIRDLDKVGTIIEAATSAGSNQVGGISFTIDDLTEIKKQARAEAIAKAKEQAKSMAELTGIKLGKLVNVYENTGSPMPYYDNGIYSAKTMGMGGAELSVAPTIQTGENEVRVEITLSYEVK
ncbi:MAG: SIMPL domain-containing protein [Patescibacteria group bacterium]|jgi:hypothetical protein